MFTVSHELLAAHTFRFSPLGARQSVQLSAAQQAVVYEFLNPTSKDLQVVAGAGAGKTATIVEAVTQVLAAGRCTERELLLVSFSANARSSLQKKLSGALNDTKNTIHTFSSLALRITGKDSKDCSDAANHGQGTGAWMAKAEAHVGGGLGGSEWEKNFIAGDDGEHEDTTSKLVLELTRLHSKGVLVTDAEFTQHVTDPTVQAVLRKFDAMLKDAGLFTFGQNAIEALRILRTFGKESLSQYKLVIIDEAQDNDIVQLEMAEILAQHGRLVLVGDPRQCIHRWRGAEPDFFIDFAKRATTRVMHLTENYRSHDEIVAFGNAVATHMPRSASVTRPMTSSSPCAALYFARYAQVAARIALQTQVADLQHDQIAVLARTWKPLWNIWQSLLVAGIRVSFKKHKGWTRSDLLTMQSTWTIKELQRRYTTEPKKKKMLEVALEYLQADKARTFQSFMDIVPIKAEKGGHDRSPAAGPPAVRLSTIQSVKGEEFDQVWLIDTGIDPRIVPGTTREEIEALEEDELRIYYTGVTRAKKRLILVDRVRDFRGGFFDPSKFHRLLLSHLRGGAAVHPRTIP